MRMLVWAGVVVAILAAPRAGTAQPKAGVPDAKAQEAARTAAADVYADRFRAAKTTAEKTAVAKEILQAATKVPDGSVDRYVLLDIAREVAAKAGDAPTALGAVEKLAGQFDVSPAKLKAQTLEMAARHASTSMQQKAVAEAALGVIDDLAAADDYELAVSLCEAARSAAQKAKQYKLANELAARAKELKKSEAAAKQYRDALAALEKDPTDPAANLAAGRYLCLVKADWTRGISMLALGSDAELKELAAKDLKGANTPDEQAALADAWWDLADKKEDQEKQSLMLRAGTWYRRAQPRLVGIARVKAEKRLEEIAKSAREVPSVSAGPASPAVAPFDETTAKLYQARWARQLRLPLVYTNSIGMKLVLIPPGEFQMGSSEEEVAKLRQNAPGWAVERISSESPKHRVKITKPFYLGMYELTQGEYERLMGSNPSEFPGDPNRPVEKVTWHKAVDFCRRLSDLPPEKAARTMYRLPTEAEWEYACRAGTTTQFSFGDDAAILGEYAWWARNSQGQTHPVGLLKPNAFGLFDMHGNVFEWCADWHGADYYAKSPAADPIGPDSGTYRVLRGGSWAATEAFQFWSAFHHFSKPHYHLICRRGFRVVRTITP